MNKDAIHDDNGKPIDEPRGDSPALPISDPGHDLNTDNNTGSSRYWEVLLKEFVHLLGLFFVHSKHAQGVRTTEVLFDQLVRHLDIFSKMPENNGAILIRRSYCKDPSPTSDRSYLVMCGSLMISAEGRGALKSIHPVKRSAHLESALTQAFNRFSEMGIHSLYIQMPEKTKKKIDQLRLALNIVARFQHSVADASSIRFRCYGRALTFPLIKNSDGQPDPNLTLMAALNGLSPVNAKELIKQAEAFHKLYTKEDRESEQSRSVSNYNQIFSARSLRSQYIKPPLEVNNLPWLNVGSDAVKIQSDHPEKRAFEKKEETRTQTGELGKDAAAAVMGEAGSEYAAASIGKLIGRFIELDAPKNKTAFDAVMAKDYEELDPQSLGGRLILATRLLSELDRHCQDPSVFDRVIAFFQHQLKNVNDSVLSNIIAQRQGLKIISNGRAILVGMVHPRLFDLITFVTENVSAKRRSAIIEEMAFNFDPCHISMLSDGFGITDKDAYRILEILKDCFTTGGRFIRTTFEKRIELMAQYENAIFEILWCFLKETQRRQDRLNFLNALQLLMVRLKNPKQATQFLLADICQFPSEVRFTDRNAFTLTNILLHQENKELYIDMNRTPGDVLNRDRRINKDVKQYLAWRLEVDKTRILSKLRTIHQHLKKALILNKGSGVLFESPFLLALEREALIFLAIVGGHAARSFLREALQSYGNADSELYHCETTAKNFSDIMAQLQILVRAFGCAGIADDIGRLENLAGQVKVFCKLNDHPVHLLRVKQAMKRIPEAIKRINA